MPFKLVFIQEQIKLLAGYCQEMSPREKLLGQPVKAWGSNSDKM